MARPAGARPNSKIAHICRMNGREPGIIERISISNTRDRLEISISGEIPRIQLSLLFGWLAAWTVAGIYVFTQLFSEGNRDTLIFMIGWMAFWAYFEYRVLTAFLWRRSGREIIRFERDTTTLQNKVPLGGK